MIARKLLRALWAGVAIFALLVASPVIAQEESSEPVAPTLSEEAVDAMDGAVASEEQAQTDARRERIIQEAVSALQETRNALTALEEERVDDALSSLAVATGQLELLLAREPGLALAPTDVTVTTHDVYGSREAIERAIDEAEDLLGDGMVQAARRLLDGIASETVITVTNVPLATYPDAIKAITPLIDEGKLDEARHGLQAALNTLVLTDHVIPLPVLRAESLLEQAQALAEKENRTAEESEELEQLLSGAREELEMAELLGYGRDEHYENLHAQIDDFERATRDGRSAKGFFSGLKESLTKIWAS